MKIAVYTYRSTESMRVRQAILDGIQGTPLEYDEDHPDIVITIGGDGTLLSAFHRYQHLLDQVRFVGSTPATWAFTPIGVTMRFKNS